MRSAALAALLLAAGCRGKDAETDAACPHDLKFDRSRLVRVRAEVPPAELRRDLDLAGLASESAGSAGPGKQQGLTEVKHQLRFQVLAHFESSRGRTCMWFQEVGVDLSPAWVKIYVPREYADDSCEFLAVLAHEREHERVHRERLSAAAAEIEKALTDAAWLPARGNPLDAPDRASAEAALNVKIRKVVVPVYDKYKEDLRAAQAELDQPALYQWVSKRCSGWK